MRPKLAVERRKGETAAGTNIIKYGAVASRPLVIIIANELGDVWIEGSCGLITAP